MPQTTSLHLPGRWLTVNGHRLWIEEEGSGEPLLLLSGGPANSHLTFHPVFSALKEQFRVIYVDYHGRGQSDRPLDLRELTFLQDVSDIAALIEELNYGPVNLYGFSYGGLVAQALALDHTALVKRLILANTLHSPEMWQRNHENINRELELQFPEEWEQILELRRSGVPSTDPRMQAIFRRHGPIVRYFNPDHATRHLTDSHSRNADLYPIFVGQDIEFFIGGEVAKLPDFRPRLHELQMPVLVLAGRYDRALYPKYQLEFKRRNPRIRLEWLERSGSFGHIEEPETVLALVREFCHK